MNNTINLDLCKKCQLCIEVCPCNILALDNDKDEIYFIKEREEICLRCGQCMAVCSTKAVSVNGLSYEKDFVDLPENKIDYDNFTDFLANRRSIRNYKDKPVPDELITKIINSIDYAPYGSKPEKINITIVNNRKTIERALPYISKFLDDIVKWIENPIASFMIKRKKGLETFNTIKNHLYPIAKSGNYKLEFGDRISRGAPALIIFHAEKGVEEHTNNSIIYASYAILAAHSLGLGASMNGIIPAAINKVEEVREVFQISQENDAVISVIVGYPKYKYKRTIKRHKHEFNWIH